MEYKQIVAKHRELSRLAQDKSEEDLLDDILQDIFVNYNEYSAKGKGRLFFNLIKKFVYNFN